MPVTDEDHRNSQVVYEVVSGSGQENLLYADLQGQSQIVDLLHEIRDENRRNDLSVQIFLSR